MVFDSLFMSFKDKPTTNPRLKTLCKVLGRVNERLKVNRCNNDVKSSDDDVLDTSLKRLKRCSKC